MIPKASVRFGAYSCAGRGFTVEGGKQERLQSSFESLRPRFPPIGYFSFLSAHRDYSSHGGWSAKPAASAGGRLSDL